MAEDCGKIGRRHDWSIQHPFGTLECTICGDKVGIEYARKIWQEELRWQGWSKAGKRRVG